MIETLQTLAWTARPVPPIGVAPWLRRQHWFRYYIVYKIKYQFWRLKNWRWERRTGNKQDWCW